MPDAAHQFEHSLAITLATGSWSGELHGEVGAMHRNLEQRLLAESFGLVVTPLPVRPMEQLLVRLSRATGWLTLAGAGIGVVTAALTLLG